MNMRPLSVVVLTACALAGWPLGDAHAKGFPDEIVVRGGTLPHAVTITDRDALHAFDPWNARFIDWSKPPVPSAVVPAAAREVLFYARWPERRTVRDRDGFSLIYTLQFAPDPAGGPGYVYLPGRGDGDRYSMNAGTIVRDGRDGRWSHASAAWSALMQRVAPVRT